MNEIASGAAHAVVASPPFTNHLDGKTLDKTDYLDFIRRVFSEVRRILRPGRLLVCVNTDLRDHARYNKGDTQSDGLVWHKHSALRALAEEAEFRCIDTKIWVKSLKRNPYRYTFSYIQFFQKPGPFTSGFTSRRASKSYPDVWLLEKGSYRRDSHGFVFRDAIHPEIVRRCLEESTVPGDLVVSPFTGSGTILSVAHLMGRKSVGYEVNHKLKRMITESVETPQRFPAYLGLSELLAQGRQSRP